MLHQNHYPSYVQDQRPYGVSHIMWKLIWKVKLPLKILTFIWKLLHDSLPVFEVLNNRGITFSSKCLMCNEKRNPQTPYSCIVHSQELFGIDPIWKLEPLSYITVQSNNGWKLVSYKMNPRRITECASCSPSSPFFGPYGTKKHGSSPRKIA